MTSLDVTSSDVTQAVARLYNTYPFPPEPLLDQPPPGYNWRWNWSAAYSFCTGQKPDRQSVRILDAGCGTGVSTEYLVHLNPEATVVGVDLSPRAIAIAQERCQKSGADRAQFHQLSLYDLDHLPGEFDLINCVGVLHHLADPVRGLQALERQLAPGGILHIFVYAAVGRWEILQMQQALAMLQGDRRGDFQDGVPLGRQIFAALPENNRLKRREQERWSLENQRDECFADMYLHPQEIDYTVETLFELLETVNLRFLGFSNPACWDLSRLLGSQPDVMNRTAHLSDRQRYQLVELLDPDITHFEFFLGRDPLPQINWHDDQQLRSAIPERHPCIDGWPGSCLFNANYEIVHLNPAEQDLLAACDRNQTRQLSLGDLLTELNLDLSVARSLLDQTLLLLSPRDQQTINPTSH